MYSLRLKKDIVYVVKNEKISNETSSKNILKGKYKVDLPKDKMLIVKEFIENSFKNNNACKYISCSKTIKLEDISNEEKEIYNLIIKKALAQKLWD